MLCTLTPTAHCIAPSIQSFLCFARFQSGFHFIQIQLNSDPTALTAVFTANCISISFRIISISDANSLLYNEFAESLIHFEILINNFSLLLLLLYISL